MGLPFETPGGYPDDNTTPDAGRYSDDLTTPDYDGYSHDIHGHQDADAEEASSVLSNKLSLGTRFCESASSPWKM